MSTSPEARTGPVVTSAVFAPLPKAREVDLRAASAAPSAAAGYAAGWAQGVAAAAVSERAALAEHAAAAQAQREQLAAQVAGALAALEAAAAQMRAVVVPSVDATADVLVAAAADLAEVLVGDELSDAEDRGRRAVARALAAAPEHEDLLVALNPVDLALLGQLDDEPLAAGGRAVRLAADPALALGDAVATFAGGEIDARIATGLARLRASLRTGGRS